MYGRQETCSENYTYPYISFTVFSILFSYTERSILALSRGVPRRVYALKVTVYTLYTVVCPTFSRYAILLVLESRRDFRPFSPPNLLSSPMRKDAKRATGRKVPPPIIFPAEDPPPSTPTVDVSVPVGTKTGYVLEDESYPTGEPGRVFGLSGYPRVSSNQLSTVDRATFAGSDGARADPKADVGKRKSYNHGT